MVEFPQISGGKYICYVDTTNLQENQIPTFKCQSIDKVLLYGGITIVVLYLLLGKK